MMIFLGALTPYILVLRRHVLGTPMWPSSERMVPWLKDRDSHTHFPLGPTPMLYPLRITLP